MRIKIIRAPEGTGAVELSDILGKTVTRERSGRTVTYWVTNGRPSDIMKLERYMIVAEIVEEEKPSELGFFA